MRIRKAVSRVLMGLGEACALLAFFLQGDADPLEPPQDPEPEDDSAAPWPPVTLSDKARDMLASGKAANAPRRLADPVPEPLVGSYEWRMRQQGTSR